MLQVGFVLDCVALTGEGGCPEQIRRRLQATPNTASVLRTEAFVNIGIMSLSMTTKAAGILAAPRGTVFHSEPVS
jgi:hypothetical protein